MNSVYLSGIGGLVLAAVFYGQLEELPHVAQRLPGLLIWIVGGLAVLMVLEEFWRQRRARPQASVDTPADGDAPAAPEAPGKVNWPMAIGFSLATTAYVWLIPILGYIITTVGFVAGTLLASRIVRPSVAILYALGATAFVWLVFIWALGLPAPLAPWLD